MYFVCEVDQCYTRTRERRPLAENGKIILTSFQVDAAPESWLKSSTPIHTQIALLGIDWSHLWKKIKFDNIVHVDVYGSFLNKKFIQIWHDLTYNADLNNQC